MSVAFAPSGDEAQMSDPNHPLSLELKSLRTALLRFQDEAHDAAIKLQRHSLESIHDHERMQHLQHDNDLLRNEVEMLRATPHPDASPSTHPSALHAQQLTIALRRLSDKLTATEETLLTRTTELANAMSETARAKQAEEGAYALASSARGREEEGKVRERDLQLQLREAQEQSRMSDLVVNEYASLVRTMEGRASNPLHRPATPRTPSTPGSPAGSPNDPSSSQLSLQSTGSSRSLTSSLHEGKMGLKKLLSEFSGEIHRLEGEIARLHGELAVSETKLQAEKQNAANDREALARARHDLERHRLDDASAAKMVSRYMKFSQISTDTLQKALAALKTRHQTTVDTLSAQLASAAHQRRAAESTASRLRDALDELGRDAMREAFGRRREVALRMQIVAQQEVIRGHLVRLVQSVGESMQRGETGVEVLSRLLQDAQGLVDRLDGVGANEVEGGPPSASVQRILAAQHAVNSLVEELQVETTRRIQLETILPTSQSALGLQAGDSAPPSLITPLSLDMALPNEASTPVPLAPSNLPPVHLSLEALPPTLPRDPSPPTSNPTRPEAASAVPPLSEALPAVDQRDARPVGDAVYSQQSTEASDPSVSITKASSSSRSDEHERTPQMPEVLLPPFAQDTHRAAHNTQRTEVGDNCHAVADASEASPNDTPSIPTLNMIAPTPVLVSFPSGDANTLNSEPRTATSGQNEPPNAHALASATSDPLPTAAASLPPMTKAASLPSNASEPSSLPSAEVQELLVRLSQVTHRYDQMQAEFRDCHSALRTLKQDVASFVPSSGPMPPPYNPASLAAAIQRIDDYAEDARVELEIRAADDALAVRGLTALLTLPGALAPAPSTPDAQPSRTDGRPARADARPTLPDVAAQVGALATADPAAPLARKLADVQHDIAATRGAVGALHGVPRPAASPTFGHVMTTPSLRRTPSLKQLGGLGALGLRVPMPAFVLQDARPGEEGLAAPRARTLSAMYMLGVGLGRGVGGSLPGTPPRRVSGTPTRGVSGTPRPPPPPPESDSELDSEAGSVSASEAETEDEDDVE